MALTALDSYLLSPYICAFLVTLWSRNVALPAALFLYICFGVWKPWFAPDEQGTNLFHIDFTMPAVVLFGICFGLLTAALMKSPELMSWYGYPWSIFQTRRVDLDTGKVTSRINSLRNILFNVKSLFIVILICFVQFPYDYLASWWQPVNGLITMAAIVVVYPIVYCMYLPNVGPVFGGRRRLGNFILLTASIHFSAVAVYFVFDVVVNNVVGSFIMICFIAAGQLAVFVTLAVAVKAFDAT